MGKTVFLFLFMFMAFTLNAQPIKVVNIKAGGLADALIANEKMTTTKLIINGTIDARDFVIMRNNMPKLSSLDLSNSRIIEYREISKSTSFNSFDDQGNTIVNEIEDTIYHEADMIPDNAFDRPFDACKLRSIQLPKNLKKIGEKAFSDCDLTTIQFPYSLNFIGKEAFVYNQLKTINLPSSIDTIEDGAFSQNSIEIIKIKKAVSFMGKEVFNSQKLKSVYVYFSKPSKIYDDTFGTDFTPCTLYVPAGSRSKFRSSPEWNMFVNISEMPKY